MMKLNFRPRPPEMLVDRSDILWGIRRRAGCGDMFDPRAQAGVKAHAFAAGRDDVAVCGFRPLRFRRRAMPLAAATEYNPQCASCAARLPEVTKSSVAVLPSLAERVALAPRRRVTIPRKPAPALVVVAPKPAPRRLAKDMTRAA